MMDLHLVGNRRGGRLDLPTWMGARATADGDTVAQRGAAWREIDAFLTAISLSKAASAILVGMSS
jgi:hypothetical protein